ncbi:MAG: ribosome biogenesis GTPase Der [Candidatus Methylomirabilis oxyfera]|nr:ribosome biogenesis GTPase Der [Candidatus Methylomirabilis oxyfera]
MTAVPVVAVVGRPNVGKSTLFNRLVGGRKAIINDEPGVTRDRHYATARWGGRTFILGDTGGLEPDAGTGLPALVLAQVRRAIQEAALILFVVDAREGVSPLDLQIAKLLRRTAGARIVVVPNKVDRAAQEALLVPEFFRLGFAEVVPVSAEHGFGVAELADLIVQALPPGVGEPEKVSVRVAVAGRPNVGKSSLVNRILGQERVIVSEQPGTTRDVIDTPFTHQDSEYILIDTAGLRSRGKVKSPLEGISALRTLRAIERCDVVLIVLDGPDGVTEQDAKIASYVQKAGCGSILVVNKWDLIPREPDAQQRVTVVIRDRLRHLDYAPITFVSTLTGFGVAGLFSLLNAVSQSRSRRVPTPEVNTLIGEAVRRHPPPSRGKRPVRFRYATQVGGPPPTFLLVVSDPRGVPVSYQRYLINQLRETYGFVGTPIRLVLKAKRA